MIQTGVSLRDQNYRPPFPERTINVEKYSGKECNNSLLLGTREERAALLKTGLRGKDIESLYLKFNSIIVVGVNWQDLNSK